MNLGRSEAAIFIKGNLVLSCNVAVMSVGYQFLGVQHDCEITGRPSSLCKELLLFLIFFFTFMQMFSEV